MKSRCVCSWLFYNFWFLQSSARLSASSERLCVQSLLTYRRQSNQDPRGSVTRTAPRSFDQGAAQLGAGDGLLSRALSSGVPSAL
jgi:hypothetical protein